MWKPPAHAALAAALFLTLPAHAEPAPPAIAASIQPLHSIVSMITDGIVKPHLLVSGAASEHGYALKPSDMRALENAKLIVLVDESYESFLTKPMKSREKSAQIIALADLPGATILPPRPDGAWGGDGKDDHRHDDRAHGGRDHGHDHGTIDGHVWLDPRNARLLAVAIAERLIELDPANAERYQANKDAALTLLQGLDDELRAKTAPLKNRPYAVFHDAYQYFETRYGLASAGAVVVDPDRPPSPKRLAQLRDFLIASKAACIFREPQFPAPVVENLAQAAGLKTGVLDPQGANLPPGPALYPTMMRNLAESLTECLTRP